MVAHQPPLITSSNCMVLLQHAVASHAVTPAGRQTDPSVGRVKPFLDLRVQEFYISWSARELLRELSTRVHTRVKYDSSYESSYESFYKLPGGHYQE
jgi:hypothetical protein